MQVELEECPILQLWHLYLVLGSLGRTQVLKLQVIESRDCEACAELVKDEGAVATCFRQVVSWFEFVSQVRAYRPWVSSQKL